MNEQDLDALRRAASMGTAVRAALAELRSAPTAAAVMDRGVEVLCTHLGFDRAFLFRVEGSEMIIDSVFYVHEPDWADEFQALALMHRPQLHADLRETEMIRRRRPLLVTSPHTDERTFKPLVTPVKTRSYVAAPIMPDDRVIGFLHADCYFQDRDVDELDRDRIWAFAEGFGFAVERALLLERLHAQQREVARLVASTSETLSRLADGQLHLTRDGAGAGARSAGLSPRRGGYQMDSLLTRREQEVIALVAEGATNQAIARTLVISETTVKSHVKRIMRKLRAGNRSEAVAKFRRLTGEDGG